jgi:hypothetical protein
MSPNRWRESQLRIILESLDTLSGVLLSPFGTFERIRDRRPIALALSTATSVAVVSGLVLVPNPPQLAEVMFDLPNGTLSIWATLPIWVGIFLAILSAQAAFVHLMAVILRGKGSYLGILCGLCFAYLPGLLTAPLVMLRAVLSSEGANAFYQVAFPLLCLWVFMLGIAAVQRNYGMTPLKAVFVCSFTLVVLVVLPAVLAVIVMTRVMS